MFRKICFFGDSITYGQHVPRDQIWTSLIEKKINSDTVNHSFVNKGVNGNTTLDALVRYQKDVQQESPDIITILFGLNDCNYWDTDKGYPRVNINLYKENMKEIIHKSLHDGVKKIILINLPKTLRRENFKEANLSLEQSRMEYNEVVSELYEEIENLMFVDITSKFDNLSESELKEVLMPDLLHLSKKGHELFYKTICPVIETAIENLDSCYQISKTNSEKSSTDIFWDKRIYNQLDVRKVNISDLTQRKLENNFIFNNLTQDDEVLEVGCGNGFLTSDICTRVKSVDAFDFSEKMIIQAKEVHKSDNVNFFNDNLLKPKNITKKYSKIVCVRVLINLRNFEEQKTALSNMYNMLTEGGQLILIEGFQNGFEELNNVRKSINMKTLSPASINYYSKNENFTKLFENKFDVKDTFNTAFFDFMTRLVYPMLVGEENATGYSIFHKNILPVLELYNTELETSCFKNMARLYGYVLSKK